MSLAKEVITMSSDAMVRDFAGVYRILFRRANKLNMFLSYSEAL